MRVIACVMVIAIHVCNIYNRAFPDLSHVDYTIAALVNAMSRISVPIFFMISGALMAGRTPDLQKSYDFHDLLTVPTSKHLWYLYALLAIYLALPLIQTLIRGLSDKMLNYLLILFGISVFGGYLLDVISVPIQYPIALIAENQYLGFFILGYVLYHREIPIRTGTCGILFTLSVLLVTVGTCWKSFAHNAHKDVYFQYRNPLLVLAAACAFLILLRLPKGSIPRAWEKFVRHVADNSFGIYIFHAVFLNCIDREINMPGVPAWFGIVLFIAVIFVLSDLSVTLYKRVARAVLPSHTR